MGVIELLLKSRRRVADAQDHLRHVCQVTGANFEDAVTEAKQLHRERPYTEDQALLRVKDALWDRWINR